MPRRLPRPKLAIERFRLDNGLRVVLNPDRSAPVVGIGSMFSSGLHAWPMQIGETAARHGIVLHELTPQQASLEEAFMDLTRDDVEFKTAAA